jgi:hypothetical protein
MHEWLLTLYESCDEWMNGKKKATSTSHHGVTGSSALVVV